MKGLIKKNGELAIERAGSMKTQLCPYGSENGSPVACGDWCPMFGEPVIIPNWDKDKKEFANSEGASIFICRKDLVFEEFADDREVKC